MALKGQDILFAMASLGFEDYSVALEIYLSKYREVSDYDRRQSVAYDEFGQLTFT